MKIRNLPRPLSALLVIALAGCTIAATPVEPLPVLNIDTQRVAVAGLSSGAYMATQAHLAWPHSISGAALVAGGPYGCAGGHLSTALGSCMQGVPAPDIDALAGRVEQRAVAGEIGALQDLSGDRVLVLHGNRDSVVVGSVAQGAARLYEKLSAAHADVSGMHITWDGEREFGHNLPIARQGDDCGESQKPYLGACGFDAAEEIFAALLGKPGAAPEKAGALHRFDQNLYRPDGDDAFLADEGYVYLPAACTSGDSCGLLVAFHGCNQGSATVGEAFVRDAGFNGWADRHGVVVLYPQVRASLAPLNPQSCWDWWGYSGDDYDTRSGVQQRWLKQALAALGVELR